MKSYLFVMRRLPHLSNHVQETLDQMLTTAAFDQRVEVLFLDDGIYQLKKAQEAETAMSKKSSTMFLALEMYGIYRMYVEMESLAERGMTVEDLVLPVQTVGRSEVNALMQNRQILIPG